MISLDQVMLLEEKVESAVAKIQQLQAENDALRNRCSELTNALSSKTEQLNSFSVDQNQIEEGIKKALDRLNAIENTVLKATGRSSVQFATVSENEPVAAVTKPEIEVTAKEPTINTSNNKSLEEEQIQETFMEDPETDYEEEDTESNFEETAPTFTTHDFNTMKPVPSQTEIDLKNQFSSSEPEFDAEPEFDDSEDNNSGDLTFDIF